MIKWLTIPDKTKINAFEQVAEKLGIPAFVVEKDWWVVRTLEIIFESRTANHLVFKGGTSLSKSWNLIHRFSEDIDLAIDRKFLGFEGELSKNKRTQLRKVANKFTEDHFYPELQTIFKEKGFNNLVFKLIDAKDSDQDPRIIEIYYPNLINPDRVNYIQPRIQIEIGCRSLIEPFTMRPVTSFLDEIYSSMAFAEPSKLIPSVNPERTFLEKLFLLHEEFHKPIEKIRVDRLSRHLYDVYQLSQSSFSEKALQDYELYNTIVEHRYHFTRVSNVDYNLLTPKTLNFLPIPEVVEAWEEDYKKMKLQMIYHPEAPSFEELLNQLIQLKLRINQLTWKLNKKYHSIKNP